MNIMTELTRLSSSGVPVSPLLLIGISMVAALLMILSAIIQNQQNSTNHCNIKTKIIFHSEKSIRLHGAITHDSTK